MMDWDEYTGRLAAVDSVEVRARVNGWLQSVHFDDGAIVEQGDLLFVIDPRPYEAVHNQAKAEVTRARVRLELAGNDLARARRLFESRAISEEELDARTQEQKEATAALQAAEAAVAASALDVEFTRVRAPIRGRIGRELVTVGNLVSGGSAGSTLLTTIVSLDPIHVYFTADERAFLRYQRLAREGVRPSSRDTANPVRIQLADEQGFPHEGRMDFVDNRVDEATGTMQGRAVVPNPDGVLTPGLFARVQLLGEGPYEAILVPDAAIGTDQAQRFVYLVGDDNVVRRRAVTPGPLVQNLRVVREGLSAGDRVVIEGLQRVRAGSPVTPEEGRIEPPEPQPGAPWSPQT
jgi:multidrug efflux system membrane fusion protein